MAAHAQSTERAPVAENAEIAAYMWDSRPYATSEGLRRKLATAVQEWGISRIWLAARPTKSSTGTFESEKQLFELVAFLQSRGVTTGLLAGEPEWSISDNAQPMCDVFWRVHRWNSKFTTAPLSEVHLDVEPHATTEFFEDKVACLREWENSLQLACAVGKALRIPLSLSVPTTYTLDRAGSILPISDDLLPGVRSMSVMAYRRQFDGDGGSRKLIEPILNQTELLGHTRSTWLGVELTTGTVSNYVVGVALRAPVRPTGVSFSETDKLMKYGRIYYLGTRCEVGRSDFSQSRMMARFRTLGFDLTADPEVVELAIKELRESGECFDVEKVALPADRGRPVVLISFRTRMPSNATMHSLSKQAVARAVADIQHSLSTFRSYAGIALHDIDAIVALTP